MHILHLSHHKAAYAPAHSESLPIIPFSRLIALLPSPSPAHHPRPHRRRPTIIIIIISLPSPISTKTLAALQFEFLRPSLFRGIPRRRPGSRRPYLIYPIHLNILLRCSSRPGHHFRS